MSNTCLLGKEHCVHIEVHYRSMKTFSLKRQQVFPIKIQEAWSFFSAPTNLGKITPAKMNFKVLSFTGQPELHSGQTIYYRVSVLPFVRLKWISEIAKVKEPFEFTDIQRSGPFSFWQHRHSFREVESGTEMTDELTYGVPMGVLGRLANSVFVEREVNAIFDYRNKVLQDLFVKK